MSFPPDPTTIVAPGKAAVPRREPRAGRVASGSTFFGELCFELGNARERGVFGGTFGVDRRERGVFGGTFGVDRRERHILRQGQEVLSFRVAREPERRSEERVLDDAPV